MRRYFLNIALHYLEIRNGLCTTIFLLCIHIRVRVVVRTFKLTFRIFDLQYLNNCFAMHRNATTRKKDENKKNHFVFIQNDGRNKCAFGISHRHMFRPAAHVLSILNRERKTFYCGIASVQRVMV